MHISLESEDLLDADRQWIAKILENKNQDVSVIKLNKIY
jgi:hypothetical protein